MMSNRDLSDYVIKYNSLPFEPIQLEYRRKLVLKRVARYRPVRLLEVGCGTLPLFVDLADDISVTVVEPAAEFADNAKRLAKGRKKCQVYQDYIESVDLSDSKFDMIILSCLLHEVSDPSSMLEAIHHLCASETIVHVNVPNANSLHRLLAVAMGLIPNADNHSKTQRLMQQRGMLYDAERLHSELLSSGFRVADTGGIFVKPFTHEQMQRLVNDGFMTRIMLDGFDTLVDFLPDFGSEIWAEARRIE